MSEERPFGGLGTLGTTGLGHTCCQCGAALGIGESTCCKCGFALGAGIGLGGHFGPGVAGVAAGGCSSCGTGTLGAFSSDLLLKKLLSKCNLCNCLDPDTTGSISIGTKGGFIVTGDVDDVLCDCTIIKLEDVTVIVPAPGGSGTYTLDDPLFICCEDIIWISRQQFPIKK